MASNDQKTELFFKTFNNTVNADQGQSFAAIDNKYPFRDYVLNESIFSNDIPSNIADFSVNYFGTDYYGIAALDLSNSGVLPGGTAQPLGISYELPGTNLKYYYKVELDFALANNFQTWYLPTDDISSNNSLLRDSIPFNYDSEFKSYFPALYDNSGATAYGLYSNTVPWLMDYKSGFIEYYTASNILAQNIYNAPPPNGTNNGIGNGKPRFSFVKYIGAKGASGGGGGGGGDASFNIIDVSNIILDGNNLMQKFSAEPWDTGLPPITVLPPSPVTKEFIIAEVDEPTANALGYFTIQLGESQWQNITFLAGISNSPATPVIKVLSNIIKGDYGFNNLNIIQDANTAIFYLTTTVDITSNGSPIFAGGLNVTLVNNNENLTSIPPLKNWSLIFQELPIGQPYTRLIDLSLNLIPAENKGMTSQDEYFNRNIYLGPRSVIFPDPGNQVPIINPTGTVDICGGLFVLNETYLNQNTGIRGQLDVCANIVGENNIIVGNDLIGLSGEIIGQGNSVFVNYKHYNDSDFTTTNSTNPNTLAPNWCNIAKLDGAGNVKSSATFQIIDKTAGVDVNITFIIGVNEGNNSGFSINVIENNWSNLSSAPLIRNLQIVKVQPGGSSTQAFYLQLDRVSHTSSSPTTDVDIRLYLNTQDANSGGDPVNPWILGSGAPASAIVSTHLEVNLQQQSGNVTTRCNVVTNAYSVNLNGGNFGYNVDMSNNDITNINQLTGNNKSIDFNSSNELDITSDNSINLIATNNVVVNIDSGNNYTFSNTSLNFDDKNIINVKDISGVNGQPLNIDGSNINLTAESDILIKTNTEGNRIILDSGVTTNPTYDQIIYQNEELEMGANTLSVRTVKASKELNASNTLIDFDISGTKFYLKPGTFDVNQHDISNVKTLTVDKIYQNSPSQQIILGNFINGTDKYIKMGNKIALHTTTSLSNAINENNTSNPNNYLTGYNDSDICGGLIYNIGRLGGPNDFSMNKLITTTSSMRFSTNFFRTLSATSTTSSNGTHSRTESIIYSNSSPSAEPFYRVGFNYTDELINNPGIINWYPGSPTYTFGDSEEGKTGTILPMKNLQLSRNQLIRVLNFTFEGYNTQYRFNGAFMGTNNTVYFEIVFGFGNNRVFELGPWSTEGKKNFQKCYEINSPPVNGGGASTTISLIDLSLNTYWNQNTSPIYQKVPIHNNTIPTAVDTGGFLYNDLAPYIFIRAMDSNTGNPWTYASLNTGSGGTSPTSFTYTISNTSGYLGGTGTSLKIPSSDLPWTAPFGAQFQFEHFIPADDNLP